MRTWHFWLLALIALAHFATFAAKPAHIDDTIYLETVKGILADPLRPLCNTLLWEMEARPIYTFALNPPLYNYQQAALVALFGWNLPLLHLLAAGYVFLAGLAVFSLARRFSRWPVAALLLVMTSPTLLPQTNLMLDVPGMALVCSAVACWVKGIDAGSRRWLALGSAAAAAALLTKYNSVVVLPLLLWYALLHRRVRSAAWLLVPVAALGLWCLHNRLFLPNGTIHLFQAQGRFGVTGAPVFAQAVKAIESWGSSFVFLPALAILLRVHRRTALEIAAAAVLIGLFAIEMSMLRGAMSGPGTAFGTIAEMLARLVGLAWSPGKGPAQIPIWPEYLCFVGNGTLLFASIALGARCVQAGTRWNKDTLFLIAWPLGMCAFNSLFAPHQAPRYYFPAFAALPLLLLRAMEATGVPFTKSWVGASVAVQALVGLLLALSDTAFASGSRAHVEKLLTLPVRNDVPICYVAHWGFQYYAGQSDRLRCLAATDASPLVGGIVAVIVDTPSQEYPMWLRTIAATRDPQVLESELRAADGSLSKLRFRRAMPTQTVSHPWPFQTICIGGSALLYAPGGYHGLLPYAWSREPFLVMEVLQRVP